MSLYERVLFQIDDHQQFSRRISDLRLPSHYQMRHLHVIFTAQRAISVAASGQGFNAVPAFETTTAPGLRVRINSVLLGLRKSSPIREGERRKSLSAERTQITSSPK